MTACLDGGARAGEQPVVGVLQLRVAREDEVGEFLGEGARWPDEAHPGLAQQAVALAAIAAPAGDPLVLPAVGGPATGGGNDMIYGQLRGWHPLAAVLAGAVGAQGEVAAGRPPEGGRGLGVGEEADQENVPAQTTTRPCFLDRLPGTTVQ